MIRPKDFKKALVLILLPIAFLYQNCGVQNLSGTRSYTSASSGSGPLPRPNPSTTPSPTPTPTPTPLPPPPPPSGNGNYKSTPFNSPFAIVYIRIPRTVGGVTRPNGPTEPAVNINGQFDAFPEVSHWVSLMSGPGQLVYRDRNGNETILFDCINQKHTPIVNGVPDAGGARECLPMDPSISFDGKKVLFSVLYGTFTASRNQVQVSADVPMTKIASTVFGAQVFEMDLTSFSMRALDYRRLGDFDTSPVYIPWDESNPHDTDRILFTTNRSRELPSSLLYGGMAARSFNTTLLQHYIADKDLKNARHIGTHERDGVLHPFVMSDGRIMFSIWTLSHMGGYRKNNSSPRNGASRENEAWIASFDSKGGNFNSIYGRHGKNSVALHFLTETSEHGWICTDDYYRRNNMGGGVTLCLQKEPVGVEGPYDGKNINDVFSPRFRIRPFTFGANRDTPSEEGGTRDPMGLPGNQLMVTWLTGNSCLRPDIARRIYQNNGCNAGIYKTSTIPAGSAQMVKIVDDPNYHEFMARVAEPYEFVYGISKPAFAGHQAVSNNGKCYIGSSSMMGEVEPNSAYSFNQSGLSSHDCAVQGCKARNVPMSNVSAMRFWEVLPHDGNFLHAGAQSANTGQPNYLKLVTGNRLRLLGDAPLKADGSFAAEIPCEKPYVMAGVTSDGEVVLRDIVPQSLRKGEVRTCTGCHLHSGRQGPSFDGTQAGNELKKLFNGSANTVSLVGPSGGYKEYWRGQMQSQVTLDAAGNVVPVAEGQIYEYKKHIVPIFNNRCISCHGAGSSLDLRELGTKATYFAALTTGYEQTSYLPNQVWHKIVAEKPALPGDWEVPRLSKYTSMTFALESQFYWKTKGARLDGRKDSDLTVDVDYGAVTGVDPHIGLDPDYIRLIKNWLDSGAYLHQGNLPPDYTPAP